MKDFRDHIRTSACQHLSQSQTEWREGKKNNPENQNRKLMLTLKWSLFCVFWIKCVQSSRSGHSFEVCYRHRAGKAIGKRALPLSKPPSDWADAPSLLFDSSPAEPRRTAHARDRDARALRGGRERERESLRVRFNCVFVFCFFPSTFLLVWLFLVTMHATPWNKKETWINNCFPKWTDLGHCKGPFFTVHWGIHIIHEKLFSSCFI